MDGYGIVSPGVHTPPNPQNVSIVGAQQKMPPVRRARWLGRNLGVCGHLDKVGVFWQVSNGICDHFIFLQQYINKKRIQKQVHSTHNTIWRDFMIWSYLWLQFYYICLQYPGCPFMFSTLQRNTRTWIHGRDAKNPPINSDLFQEHRCQPSFVPIFIPKPYICRVNTHHPPKRGTFLSSRGPGPPGRL